MLPLRALAATACCCLLLATHAARGAPTAPRHPRAVVTNQGDNSVTLIDLATREVVATVPVGQHPAGVAAGQTAGEFAYVSNPDGNDLSIVDLAAAKTLGTIATGPSPLGLAADPVRPRLYVANWYDQRVEVVETKEVMPEDPYSQH